MQREQRLSRKVRGRALALGGALALAFAGSGTAFASTQNPIAAKEWALNTLNVTAVRQQFQAHGAGVLVAVIDSGVDANQPDLKGRLVDGVNLVDPSSPASDYSDTTSDSHGTSVATVIAGIPHTDTSGNSYGMIGLADQAKIMPIKVVEGTGASDSSIIAGVEYAVSHGAQVISISLGGAGSDPSLTSAINGALAHGVVVVVGAGNDAKSGNASNDLATVPGVIDVGGVDSNGQKYSFSHYGPDVDVAAPANDIEVGLANGQYGEVSGTSQATPWVSGEAALLIAAHPTWTSGQIVAAVIDNTMQTAGGQTKAGQRVDDNVGYGVIDPVAALGASEPASTTNPLGGPAITGKPGASASASTGSTATGGSTTGTTTPTASSKSSSKAPLYIGIAVAVVVVIALLIFLLTRGSRNRGGKGGPGGGASGGGGGGGGNAYYPQQTPQGGQYGQQSPQQPNPQQQPNPYQQPQQGGYPPPQGGYGQQPGPGQQNPYSGQ
ncbi:S8 family peptidase [Actinospica sp.]|uniref:S8 family peptidase n=1 Tax=Actinospica sp. TaxID=1872142 RepID=UPI002B50AF53|nr:S8 family serine peptidase [Actinospica sp.]HWG25165.1 S8 family serine peptidase [Actinospica sp.]